MKPVIILSLLAPARAWTTISQARFGAQISTIQNLMHYPENRSADWRWPFHHLPDQQILGYLWSMPNDPTDHRGLGGGITWAWDPALCTVLQERFNENFLFLPAVDCQMLKAAMNRGFATWSANSAWIHFVDVTDECAQIGQLGPDCSLAELWVTWFHNDGSGGGGGGSTSSSLETAASGLSVRHSEAEMVVAEELDVTGATAALAQPK